ncbi:tRNA pseudouridine(38-40) synthase TruA [Halobaculum sp. MBLA0143]|uniref:tRNA pseudouridine(38-40) synthase TruA n=1 Tax=Halobaculum sp. MBLA0143 TaxID=3079933 RepID=UPI0035241B74
MRAYRVAYDGRPFHGFQRQPDVSTVADALLDALVELDLLAAGGDGPTRPTPPGYAAAGRTDAGVSALAQTVAFEAPDWLSPRALNAHLPESVRAWAVADAPDAFHATHDAVRRAYVYHLHAPAADPDRARTAAARLSGSHDFHNLTPDETGTRRDLDCRVESGRTLRVRVAADGFPRQLVRRLVAVVRAFAAGECDDDRLDRLLSATAVDGPEGVAPAPPAALLLARVDYPELSFTPNETAVADVRQLFRERRRRGLASAGVADSALDDLG